MTTTDSKSKPKVVNLNKPAYIIFVLTGLYFMIVKDYSQASIFVCLSLVFDPFNIETPFKQRPLYQKIWLIVHLIFGFSLFGLLIANG